MSSKYQIGLVELHHELLHGPSDSVSGHYLVIDTFANIATPLEDIENVEYNQTMEDNYDIVQLSLQLQKDHYRVLCQPGTLFRRTRHKTIRNYHYIVSRNHFIQPHIIECFYLGDSYVAVIKTFWLRLFQRRCRAVLKERKRIQKARMHPNSLRFREIHGFWPPNPTPDFVFLMTKDGVKAEAIYDERRWSLELNCVVIPEAI